ncbi:penicillin-binding protein 2, partial [bacterium]|nr:penicillin-binding protein 2 [bacterium]
MLKMRSRGEKMTVRARADEARRFNVSRLISVGGLFSLVLVLIFVRLVRLQLVQAEIYLQQSETNRVRVVERAPLRGLILDRDGEILVDNFPSYSLY